MAYSPKSDCKTTVVGHSVGRKDTLSKITGRAKYTDDVFESDMLHAVLLTSPYAHARILSIDKSRALKAPGVRAVLLGIECPKLTGDPLADRPILAIDTVRYAGEPVAIVIADELHQAGAALALIDIVYTPLPVIQSPKAAYEADSPLLHPDVHTYRRDEAEANPIPGTNIASHVPIRKGDPDAVWASCDAIVEVEVSFPQAHHAYMETPSNITEINPDGEIHITTSTQSPYTIATLMHDTFDVAPSSVRGYTPFVGGGFGGKSSPYIDPLVVAASKAVGGRKVKLRCEREQAMMTLPCHIGLVAKVRLGAKRDGRFVGVDITYWFDGGAYGDRAVIVTRAAVQDCTGPYRIPHVRCDGFCMYTNHPPATAYRGFGHPEQTLVIERAVDVLARRLHLDPLEIRRLNAIRPGDSTPTQTLLTGGRVGDLVGCIHQLETMMGWDGSAVRKDGPYIIAKGISCSWKTSSTPPNASSGAVLRVNQDSTVTLLSGVVEIGQGTKTALAQMVAEIFAMNVNQVDVIMEVDTKEEPEHWKTVASRGTLLAGNAAVRAAADAIRQLKQMSSVVFQCRASDVQISNGVASCPHVETTIPIGSFSNGYTFRDGRSVGGMVIGRGSYTIEDVTPLNPETGEGSPGPEWTVAAQGVEVEVHLADYTYRVLNAFSVIDAGKVIHPDLALGQVKGAMNMGLSLASREGYVYNRQGVITNPQFRVYPVHRYGDQPKYHVAFLETPDEHAPWGLRGLGEHGLIGMPAALASALSNALDLEVNHMPMSSELLWRIHTGGLL
ncbi:xanthine dehydrogenase family protein molybdopterin-binding subunit [Alicyclobacillus tolerans]|uniref:xanthine dehydrogenase family protein molybdopterin-binding subunit n=1 Tax=Alicyclobacillus tolerans TaxID=90970 RepID=UPI001F303A00|nr:xanthine dehydrogenase family protein molybdopterin-binding subunit [Alicyclobacillus tolerans]MCF8567491.1 xanthine dehydrogenase family protein molybdopterin-binding subunit [Alicyclobacillus tolerans]